MTEMVYNGSDQKRTSSRPPILLRNEKVEDFESLHEQLKQEIQPRGFIEEMYVGDIAALVWDIMRLRRLKAGILNNAYQKALKNILSQLFYDPDKNAQDNTHRIKADKLACKWFTSSEAKEEVAKLLGQRQLDQDSIVAEAFRLTAPELERIDRMMTLSEVRRERALGSIADYRLTLAKDLEQRSSRILENDAVAIEQ
jgi:hypothetical protein